MGWKTNSALAVLVAIIAYYLQRQRQQKSIARQKGCQPPRLYPALDVLFNLDFTYAQHHSLSFGCKSHEIFGRTFLVESLFFTPSFQTIAPENLQAINNRIEDWGVEPSRRAGIEYFIGLGFITCDGDIWQHSRKVLRPSFHKSNISDLTPLAVEVDSLLDKMPTDGSTIDLQPLFFLMVD